MNKFNTLEQPRVYSLLFKEFTESLWPKSRDGLTFDNTKIITDCLTRFIVEKFPTVGNQTAQKIAGNVMSNIVRADEFSLIGKKIMAATTKEQKHIYSQEYAVKLFVAMQTELYRKRDVDYNQQRLEVLKKILEK